MDSLKLLVHPVRLRIVHALSGGRALTTAELSSRMHDVSKATVYRHVGRLADAGVLEVAAEQRVHGAVERHYRLRRERAVIGDEAVASVSKEEHRRVFAAAMAILIAEFGAYLDRESSDPVADSVGYRQHALWLDGEELAALIAELRAAIVPRLGNEPVPGRAQYLLSPILFPIEEEIR
ncbi:helix-turn-helix domain-containing protein [Amycolatopsis cynarae]|uniref:Helix-turn-helix domain-containing protein n=1 Tax=Amycolatopsis cynarae TaxID=2995223 RepID=A0ABY7AX55_9PSEU|nr:helix-turn-helix domain-containing protein [Amycolatopsis sp. HUAS 11-8]WAL64594.1 helix-turn-helix domain-containing protein [Amycolatopsis sp. HUAS 11-8]